MSRGSDVSERVGDGVNDTVADSDRVGVTDTVGESLAVTEIDGVLLDVRDIVGDAELLELNGTDEGDGVTDTVADTDRVGETDTVGES